MPDDKIPVRSRPWQELDQEVGAALLPTLATVADDITAAIAAEIPDYRLPMDGAFGYGVREAIEETLRQFVAQLGQPASGVRPGRDVYLALGRGEFRAGRPLDALQHAYRVGARVAWRRMWVAAVEAGIDGPPLALLAESIFAYIDEISAESVEGYAGAQAASAGERARDRATLVRLLLDGSASSDEAHAAAAAAGWPLPATLATIATRHRDADRFATIVGEGAIAARVDEFVCALVPDPDAPGRRERIRRAVEGRHAALGPSGPWGTAPTSWTRALRCIALVDGRVLREDGLIVADERLGLLAVHADPALVRDLATARLAPLAGATPASRARLEATLLSWLAHQGAVSEVAVALHVHPQTVRYRLARLRDHFGAELDDPDTRFELELALRARVPAAGTPIA